MVTTRIQHQYLSVCLPLAGVREPLDVAIGLEQGDDLILGLIDAVGQGAGARRAVLVAQGALRLAEQSVAESFVAVHRALEGTSGVSLAIARLAPDRGVVEFSGIGRIYGGVTGRGGRVLQSTPGTVGLGKVKVPATETYRYRPGETVALAADGQVDVWDLAGLWRSDGVPLETLVRWIAGAADRLPEDASLVLGRAR
jgi:hypothetical protein